VKNNKVGLDKKTEQIKQELENKKNSSNRYTRQAYQKNQAQVENLLKELEGLSQNSQTSSNKFREAILPISLIGGAGLVAVVSLIIIKRRKKNK